MDKSYTSRTGKGIRHSAPCLERIRSIIENAQGAAGLDSTIYNIIIEEAESYFSGQKTVEDAAGIIQRRAAMYVSENS